MRRVTLAAAALLLISACDGQILGPERAFSPDRPLLSSQPDDGYLVTTGTHVEDWSFWAELMSQGNGTEELRFVAGRFTLETSATTETVEAFMRVLSAGDLNVLIRADDGGVPGDEVASGTYSVSVTDDAEWILFDGYDAELPSGTYWLTVEPAALGGFWAIMMSGAEQPLSEYRFRESASGGWESAPDGSSPGLGIRISGIPGEDEVETPTSGSAPEALQQLVEEVESVDLHKGARASLTGLLENAIRHFEGGRLEAACAMLQAAEQQLESQSGRQVPAATAADLKARVEEVRVLIEC